MCFFEHFPHKRTRDTPDIKPFFLPMEGSFFFLNSGGLLRLFRFFASPFIFFILFFFFKVLIYDATYRQTVCSLNSLVLRVYFDTIILTSVSGVSRSGVLYSFPHPFYFFKRFEREGVWGILVACFIFWI